MGERMTLPTSSRLRVLILICLTLLWCVPRGLIAADELATPLPVDPAIHRGALDNGVRYWIRSHATPPGKISLWMHVATGSLNEQDGQEGIAHYLEHLAFNGSAHFPPGELVTYFESIGLRFGQHQNAFTSFDQTTYTLTLPNTKADTIDKGVLYLSDVGFRMLLLPEEIEKERSVLLEEQRARKGVRQRLTDQLLPQLLPGSRVARRLPIGLERSVMRFQRDDFLAYYHTWYHPAKVTILAVGDAPVDTIKAAISKHFGGWTSTAPPRPDEPKDIHPYTTERAIILTDPELTTATVKAVALQPRHPATTIGDLRQRLVERLGTWIVNRRLHQLIQEGKSPAQRASVHIAPLLGVVKEISAEAHAEPSAWREAFTSVLVEVERARQYGLTPQELADAKQAMLAATEHAAQTEPTRDARAFLRVMNRAITAGTLPRSAAQSLQLVRQLLPGITAHDVDATFSERFAPGPKAYVVTLPEQDNLSVPTPQDVLGLVHNGQRQAIEPWHTPTRPSALLTKAPIPGVIADKSAYDALGITNVTFANNVRLHHRFMDFKKDHVTVVITLAGGLIRETADNRGITAVATLPLKHPATSRFSSTALRDFMTGKKVRLSANVTSDAVTLRVSGTPDALEDGLQLAHVLLQDATIEPTRVALWKRRTLQALEAQQTRVGARTYDAVRRLLSGDDPRMGMLTPSQVHTRAQDIQQAQAWLQTIVHTAPMEVAVVGDIATDRALELAATYLGSLPTRLRYDPDLTALRHLPGFIGPREQRVEVKTITPRAQPVLLWRSAPWSDVKNRRLMHIASRILERRVREEIRENRGLTYSTSTYVHASKVYEAMSALYVQFTTDPDKAAEAVQLARRVVETFAAEGPTDAEMRTVRKQLHHTVNTMLKEPRFWVNLLADLDYHHTKLEDVEGLLDTLLAYSKEEVATAVKQTVQAARFASVVGLPVEDCKTDKAACDARSTERTL